MAPDAEKAMRMLGLATRARKTLSGTMACEKAIARGKAQLILIAADAAEDTRERMSRLCRECGIPFRISATGDKLGQYTGKDHRVVVGITDPGFAERICELLDEIDA